MMAVRPHSETLGPVIPRSGAGAWHVVCGCVRAGTGTRGRVHNIAAFLLPPLHTLYISISTSTHTTTSHRPHLYYTPSYRLHLNRHMILLHCLVLMFTINYMLANQTG